jgi:hexokinase
MKSKNNQLEDLLEELRELLTIDTECLNQITDQFVQELDKGKYSQSTGHNAKLIL